MGDIILRCTQIDSKITAILGQKYFLSTVSIPIVNTLNQLIAINIQGEFTDISWIYMGSNYISRDRFR